MQPQLIVTKGYEGPGRYGESATQRRREIGIGSGQAVGRYDKLTGGHRLPFGISSGSSVIVES